MVLALVFVVADVAVRVVVVFVVLGVEGGW